MKRNLSYYFRIPKENKILSKPVIDYIVENLPTTQKNDLMEYLESDKYTIKNENIGVVNRARLAPIIKKLEKDNFFDLPDDEAIKLYKEKYVKETRTNITQFFYDIDTNKYLDLNLIKCLINTLNATAKRRLIRILGNDYINNPKLDHSSNYKAYKYLRNKLNEISPNNIFQENPTTLIELLCINKKMNFFEKQMLIENNDLMNAYIYLIENDEKFSKIESEYSFNLAVIYFMYCGKYLDNNFTIEEISQILDISYEDTCQNIHVLKKI